MAAVRYPNRVSSSVLVATFLVIVTGWALFAWQAGLGREQALGRAADVATTVSRSLAEHAEQSIATAEAIQLALALRADVHQLLRGTGSPSLLAELQRLQEGWGVVASFAIADRDGTLVFPPSSAAPGSIADRGYFQQLRRNPAGGLVIGERSPSQATGTTVLPLARAILDADGGFAGAVVVSMAPEYFHRVYRSVGADTVYLGLRSGMPLVREPNPSELEKKVGLFTPELVEQMRRVSQGALIATSPIDGRQRIYGFAKPEKYFLIVLVGFDLGPELAPWLRQQAATLGIGAAGTLVVLLLGIALHRRTQRQEELTAELAQARDAAEAANRAKSQFLAHMSHELRTPLNAINGFAEIMTLQLFGQLNARYRDYSQQIKSSGDHLLAIINNILDLAKVDAGKWEVHLEPIPWPEIAGELESLTKGRATAHGVGVAIELDGLPAFVSDKRVLLQVLVNLTVNGIKFSPGGSQVVVRGSTAPGALRLEVSDTGCGMSAAEAARVFDPFRSGASELARRHHETGLGLPLCKRFTELLGGSIALDSVPGQGTRVRVEFPLPAAATAPAPRAMTAALGG